MGKLENKTMAFFAGILLIALGVTKTFQNELLSIILIFLGVYLAIKGLE